MTSPIATVFSVHLTVQRKGERYEARALVDSPHGPYEFDAQASVAAVRDALRHVRTWASDLVNRRRRVITGAMEAEGSVALSRAPDAQLIAKTQAKSEALRLVEALLAELGPLLPAPLPPAMREARARLLAATRLVHRAQEGDAEAKVTMQRVHALARTGNLSAQRGLSALRQALELEKTGTTRVLAARLSERDLAPFLALTRLPSAAMAVPEAGPPAVQVMPLYYSTPSMLQGLPLVYGWPMPNGAGIAPPSAQLQGAPPPISSSLDAIEAAGLSPAVPAGYEFLARMAVPAGTDLWSRMQPGEASGQP